MTEVKLKRISKNVTASGQLRCVFVDELHPITDADGNPRLLGDGTPEYEQIAVTVTPTEYTEDGMYTAIEDAADKALDTAIRNAERKENVTVMSALLEGLDADDPEVVFEGEATLSVPEGGEL